LQEQHKQKPMKPHDLLDFIRCYIAEIASSRFTGSVTLVVHWGQGGIQKVEVQRREVVK